MPSARWGATAVFYAGDDRAAAVRLVAALQPLSGLVLLGTDALLQASLPPGKLPTTVYAVTTETNMTAVIGVADFVSAYRKAGLDPAQLERGYVGDTYDAVRVGLRRAVPVRQARSGRGCPSARKCLATSPRWPG